MCVCVCERERERCVCVHSWHTCVSACGQKENLGRLQKSTPLTQVKCLFFNYLNTQTCIVMN